MVAPFIKTRRQVALEIEAVEGTAETLVDADVIYPAYDIEWSPEIQMEERDVTEASFSRTKKIAGTRMATISFSAELKGAAAAGTAPGHLSDALKCCGFSEAIVVSTSVTYAPASATISSATVEVREGDSTTGFKVHQIKGARGNVQIQAVVGQIVLCRFEFKGVYVEPTDGVALVTPATGVIPQAFLSTGFAFGGTALKIQNLSINMNNVLAERPDSTLAAGILSVALTGRAPTAEVDPEEELAATKNFWNLITAATTSSMSFALTGAAGNITTVTAPVTQIISGSRGDRNNITTSALQLELKKSAAAGDDELTIVFT